MGRALVLVVIAGCYRASELAPDAVDPTGDASGDALDGCVRDDFNGSLDLARWDASATGSAGVNLQDLVLALPAPATDQKVTLSTKQPFDFTDGEIRIEIVQPPGATGGMATASFRLDLGTATYELQVAAGGAMRVVGAGVDVSAQEFHPIARRHWRIRHVGNALAFETSADRVSWTEIDAARTSPNGSLTAARAQLELASTSSEAAVAWFDNFELVTRRCPELLPMPPIALDTFDSSSPLDSHTGEIGATWTRISTGTGTALCSNLARTVHHDDGDRAIYRTSGAPPGPDYDVEADLDPLQVLNGITGIVARAETGPDGYFFGLETTDGPDTGEPRLLRFVDGNTTMLACSDGQPIELVAGRRHRIRLSVRGTQITALFDGVTKCAVTDDLVTAAGTGGLMVDGTATNITGLHLDNLLVTDPAR